MNLKELICHLEKETCVLNSSEIKKAFETIDRADFVLKDYKTEAYEDHPLPIGYSQTISQPTTVAFMLELLEAEEGQNILDVGSGSGWTTALLASLVGGKGKVTGIEIIPELAKLGQKNLGKYNFKNAKIFLSDGRFEKKENAPYDRILVSASANEVPEELINQLKFGGVMIIPVVNTLIKLEKVKDGLIKKEEFPGFAFVPLINKLPL